MKPNPLLDAYQKERSQLLQSISALLAGDPDVRAAWLFGSLGRGDEDALSDIDLWVIMEDASIDEVIAHPLQYASRAGEPLLFLEGPQNAPEGGAYLMACYDAPTAPHIVDWYWQPRSLAFLPGRVRLVFDKADLDQKDGPIIFPGRPSGRETIERPMHFTSFFWMMLMITAKTAARDPWAAEMELMPHLIHAIDKTQRVLGVEPVLSMNKIPPHPLPEQKLRLLQGLAEQMKSLMAAIAEQGEEVPTLVLPGISRYLKMVEIQIISGDKGNEGQILQ